MTLRAGPATIAGSWMCCLLAAGCGVGRESPPTQVDAAAGRQPFEAAALPKAACGAADRPEPALQGQVPAGLRAAGFTGYACNLELVGQFAGEGASWQMAWYDDCAYYDTAKTVGINTNGSTSRPNQAHPGVAVIDAAESANPQATAYLATEAMLDPWESLKTEHRRGLLAAVDGAGSGGSNYFDIYDVAGDCRQPQLLSSAPIGAAKGHAGEFSADGTIYYGTDTGTGIRAIDVTDPAQPVLLAEGFPVGTHDISTSSDGLRTYQAVVGLADGADNGLAIVDVSEVHQRKPDPTLSIISQMFWVDGAAAQMTQEFRIAGRTYLLFTDEGLSSATKSTFCNQGLPPFGFARIIDIADPAEPRLVAKLKLEIHQPENCEAVLADGSNLFGYDSHYCTVDDRANATAIACGHIESGIRVFDIRDPYAPREVAYYNPPARPGYQPGSNFNSTGECGTIDWSSSMPRFRKDRGELWFTSQCNGFQVLKFTNGAWPFAPGS